MDAAGARSGRGCLRGVLSPRSDDPPELHGRAVPGRDRAHEVRRVRQLFRSQRPDPRLDLPPGGRNDGEVHRHHRLLRVPARADHRPRRQLELQGPGRDACSDARSVGDSDGDLGPDVAMDVQRRLRRDQRRSGPPSHHRPLPRVDLRPEHGTFRRSTSGRRRRSSRSCCSRAFR